MLKAVVDYCYYKTEYIEQLTLMNSYLHDEIPQI